MIGSLVGAAAGIGGAIFGGISASKAMKKVKKNIENAKAENESWYTRRYNEDATQRADAQRILTQTQDSMRQRNRAAEGAQAVMGGTDESVAAAANNAALAEATSQIAVAGERRKDAVEQQYQQQDAQLDSQLNNMEINKANAIAQAVQSVSSAAGNLGF